MHGRQQSARTLCASGSWGITIERNLLHDGLGFYRPTESIHMRANATTLWAQVTRGKSIASCSMPRDPCVAASPLARRPAKSKSPGRNGPGRALMHSSHDSTDSGSPRGFSFVRYFPRSESSLPDRSGRAPRAIAQQVEARFRGLPVARPSHSHPSSLWSENRPSPNRSGSGRGSRRSRVSPWGDQDACKPSTTSRPRPATRRASPPRSTIATISPRSDRGFGVVSQHAPATD